MLACLLLAPAARAEDVPSYMEELCGQEETAEGYKKCMEAHPECNTEKTEADTIKCIEATKKTAPAALMDEKK